ncbi:alpha/beta hydrolase-fold protein [Pinirhizobacter soli]|uniref:alpha/beta hydrolase-fold protein n=1 Tax=Pinirhizobacter soli TaxID=2786953 RepID=UPI00202A4385|nr:alpha/beta hydrolase-fold protein [Pinirhizobacter soli]
MQNGQARRTEFVFSCARTITFLVLCFLASTPSYAQKDNRIVIGTTEVIHSSVLGEDRTILVHVPHGEPGQRYPVLYVLDGEDHFGSAVAITEQLSGVFPQLIVVGIENTARQRDLTPDKGHIGKILSASESARSGGGGNFMSFLEKDLIPYVDGHYPSAPYRILSGHSLGGLAVINAFFNHTALFNAYIAIDPSLWWDDQDWVKAAEKTFLKKDFANRRLFVAAANNIPAGYDVKSILKDKTGLAPVTQAVLPFVSFLRENKLKGLDWSTKFYENERHGTVELNAEYDALRYIFRDFEFNVRLFDEHPDWDRYALLEAHYKQVSQRMGYTVLPSESMVNQLGYACMERHQMKQALALFERNTNEHPQSANAFDSLGDYYSEAGDKPKAMEAFSKSLTLGATKETRQKLDELKGK